jgi:Tol biopolymer transport system component
MTDNDFDNALVERLRAYESRVAGAPVPGLDEAPVESRRSRLGWTFVVAAGGVAAGFALALALNARIAPPVGQPSTSPTPTLEAPESGAPSPVATEPAEATSPPSEPAGLLAVSRDGNVHLIRGDGTSVRQLTDDPNSGEAPVAWLLDGSALVYAVTANDNPYSSTLWLVSADGSQSSELGVVHPIYGAPTRSPDGTRIAFGGDGGPSGGIQVLDLADGSLNALTDDGGTAPIWSPDGALIAYNGAQPDGTGIDVHVVPADGSGESVALAPHSSQDGVIRWVAVGGELKIVFESWRDTNETKFAARPWVMNADGTDVQLLSDSGLDPALANRQPEWLVSPNGEWVVVAEPTGAIVGLGPNAEDARALPETQGWAMDELSPTFSPDGSFLAYSHAVAGVEPRHVVAVVVLDESDPEELEPEIITPEGVSDSAPAWQPVP